MKFLNYFYLIIDLHPKGKSRRAEEQKMSTTVINKAYAEVAWMRLGELLRGYDDRYDVTADDLNRGFGFGNKFVAELKKIEQQRHGRPKFETNSALEALRAKVLTAYK